MKIVEWGMADLEEMLFVYMDQIMLLFSADTWSNLFMDCTKNELMILLLLYRRTGVNMTQIAEYVKVPLNTATGIIDRMEKKKMVLRERSLEDKRVITIGLAHYGEEQIKKSMKELLFYGRRIMGSLTVAELELLQGIMQKVITILQEDHKEKPEEVKKKVRKITVQ